MIVRVWSLLSHKDLCQGTGFIDITGCMRLSIDLLGDINGLLPAPAIVHCETPFFLAQSGTKARQKSILSTCFQTASSFHITFDILSQKSIFFKRKRDDKFYRDAGTWGGAH